VALNLPNNSADCDALAQIFGALAQHDTACLPVSGKEIKITDSQHSVMEGFEITNFNFHCSGVKPAVPTRQQLPGPVANPQKGQFV
jgi:hypothetical protein